MRVRKAACIAIALSFVLCSAAFSVSQLVPEISPAAIRAHMEFLADDLLEGRKAGTRGQELANAYVASQLRQIGLFPCGDNESYFQPIPVKTVLTEPSSSITLELPAKKRALVFAKDFVIAGDVSESVMSTKARLVFVGYGITAPELNYDDYAGLDVVGKIVLLLYGTPPNVPDTIRAFYALTTTKMNIAFQHGAVGILSIFTPADEKGCRGTGSCHSAWSQSFTG